MIFTGDIQPTVADDAYGGELTKVIVDEQFYTRKTQLALEVKLPYDYHELYGHISLAGVIAMRLTRSLSPAELVETMAPNVCALRERADYTIEQLELFGRERSLTRFQTEHTRALLGQFVLYEALCMYDYEDERAKKERYALAVSAFNAGVSVLKETLERWDPGTDSINGALREMTTVALLNMIPDINRLALPTLSADDYQRKTDVRVISNEPDAVFRQYIQVGNRKKLAAPEPHQAIITDERLNMADIRKGLEKWKTTRALVSYAGTPEGKAPNAEVTAHLYAK